MIGRTLRGGMGGCGEMSGGVEIVFNFHVACASPPFLCAGVAPRDLKKSTRKRARVSWWSCPGPRTIEGTRKIASKNPQEVDERENPPLLKRPYCWTTPPRCWRNSHRCWRNSHRCWRNSHRLRAEAPGRAPPVSVFFVMKPTNAVQLQRARGKFHSDMV